MSSDKPALPRLTPKYGTPSESLQHPLSPSIEPPRAILKIPTLSPAPGAPRARRDSAAPLVSSAPLFTQHQVELARSANSSRHPSPSASPIPSPTFRSAPLLSDQFLSSNFKQRKSSRSRSRSGSRSRSRTGRSATLESEDEVESEGEEEEEEEEEEQERDDESEDESAEEEDEDATGSDSGSKYGDSSQPKHAFPPTSFPNEDHSNGRDVQVSGFPYPLSGSLTHTVNLLEEDVTIFITGILISRTMNALWNLGCILSGGALYLLGRWIPSLYVRFVGKAVPVGEADFAVVTNSWNQIDVVPVQRTYYNGALGSIFPPEQVNREMAAGGLTTMPGGDEYMNPSRILPSFNWFEYRYIRFGYHPGLKKALLCGYWKDQGWTNTRRLQQGLTREIHQERAVVFGRNEVDVKEKSVGQLLFDEILHPFYIFQIFSIILWCFDDYYYYAFCIFIISVTSITSTLIETRSTMRKMRKMSQFVCSVKVFRSGFWRMVESTDLVPGDVFDVRSLVTPGALHTVPCDALLLTGDAILNEAMLTGESIPVPKVPITDMLLKSADFSLPTIPAGLQKHFLFSGTRIVRARGPHPEDTSGRAGGGVSAEIEQPALAMTLRTGFTTSKGSLIRSMLFPKPSTFKFYRDSFRFIGVLSIVAFLGLLVSSYNLYQLGVPISIITTRVLDLITVVIPPALPATMSIGTSFAISRLKSKGVYCIAPMRVNVGGKIECMCFDKTGTLTVEGLDVLGVRLVHAGRRVFLDEIRTPAQLAVASSLESSSNHTDQSPELLYTMTTCHALKLVNGDLIGDPLDLKMFEFSGWELEEGGGTNAIVENGGGRAKPGGVFTFVRPRGGRKMDLEDMINAADVEGGSKPLPLEFGIMQCFEFAPSLRRMSVIVRRLTSSSLEVYCKGAPEVMTEIFPKDFNAQLHWYTHRGYRVIACASKSLGKLSYIKAQKVKREQIEQDLQFLGFIVFENKLKPETARSIAKLHDAGIRQIMCTGDNLLTAISVSRECGLIDKNVEVYKPRFISGDSSKRDSVIVWESVINEGLILDPYSFQPSRNTSRPVDDAAVEYPISYAPDKFELAVSGDAFRWLIDFSSPEALNLMFVKAQIFARMSPDEKQELVERLQGIDYCVGFCGDGANDCGALKAANVGISLSEAEASVAAPFTSQTMEIGCVVDVIKEGRAALVTSFSCFKYMALYSIIQFTTVSLLYSFGSDLGDLQFLYIDLFLTLPIAIFMAYTEPYPHLARKRPTANLVSKKVITSLLGQILIQSGFQLFLIWFVRHQTWYKPPDYDPTEKNIISYENTALFQLSCFQYILISVVFSIGPPYRKPMWTNVGYVISSIVLVTITAVIVLFPFGFFMDHLELLETPFSFRCFVILLAAFDMIVSWVCEKHAFPLLVAWVGSLSKGIGARGGYEILAEQGQWQKKHSKMYKQIKANLEN